MSLKFLAVGQSIVGIRGEKSPYALRKENRLPTFESAPRFKESERTMVQTDWLESRPPAEPVQNDSRTAPAESEPAAMQQPSLNTIEPAPVATCAMPGAIAATRAKPKRRWWSFFKFRWFRTSKPANEFVQSELSLEKIQVMRNDLADADLELVLKRKKKTRPVFSAVQQNEQLPRQGWSELTAKLFEIGQK